MTVRTLLGILPGLCPEERPTTFAISSKGTSWRGLSRRHDRRQRDRPRSPTRPTAARGVSAVFLAAPQLVALAERAPAGLLAGAVFLGGLQSSYWDATWTTAIIVAARHGQNTPDGLSQTRVVMGLL